MKSRKWGAVAGDRFGRLVTVERGPMHHNGSSTWICVCDCGGQKVVPTRYLMMGATKSCGCLPRGQREGQAKTHGLSRHPLHQIWTQMKNRCSNVNHPSWARYGGRGIKVCKRWRESFAAFMEDVGPRPSPKHSLDRIDNNKGYAPDNVRWATAKEQAANQRPRRSHVTKIAAADGVTFKWRGKKRDA